MKKTLLLIVLLIFTDLSIAQCYDQITFGGAHTIGKRSNGTLWGWGYGAGGQLLTSNETEPNIIQLGSAMDWNKVSNGVINTLAIKNNGTL